MVDWETNPSHHSAPDEYGLSSLAKIRCGSLWRQFSVPIALFWAFSDADGTELLGAFRPKKAINTMGLYFFRTL